MRRRRHLRAMAWVQGQAVYGSGKTLRVMLERREKPDVLAVRGNEPMLSSFRLQTAQDLAGQF
jgi:hypothetical protein